MTHSLWIAFRSQLADQEPEWRLYSPTEISYMTPYAQCSIITHTREKEYSEMSPEVFLSKLDVHDGCCWEKR